MKIRILSTSERAAARKRGKRHVIKVKGHKRIVRALPMKRQYIKDRMIEDFAVRFIGVLERSGSTPQDERHVAALGILLKDAVRQTKHKLALAS